MMWEARTKTQDFADRFKLSVMAHDPSRWVRVMYPDWFKDEDRLDAPAADLDDTSGTWEFEEKVTPEDAEALMSEFLENTSGTITADDVWR